MIINVLYVIFVYNLIMVVVSKDFKNVEYIVVGWVIDFVDVSIK